MNRCPDHIREAARTLSAWGSLSQEQRDQEVFECEIERDLALWEEFKENPQKVIASGRTFTPNGFMAEVLKGVQARMRAAGSAELGGTE